MLTDSTIQRARAALQSFFVGDALSMPVHWFYNPLDIQRAFPGGVQQMEAAPAHHPSSIMRLHSTNAGGRGKQSSNGAAEIIGDVILKGKRQYWGIANGHYHQGLRAGENTLNAWCARLLINTIIEHGSYRQDQFLSNYIDFMTAEKPQHPDTYAESYHRGFFAKLQAGNPPEKCAAVTHDTPSIGGLVTIVPLALHLSLLQTDPETIRRTCRDHLFLTHPDEQLAKVCDALVDLVHGLLFRAENQDPQALLVKAGKAVPGTKLDQLIEKAPSDLHVIGRQYSSACYITDSWPCMLYLAGKYQPNTEAALLANTNAGGENAHRGAVLGSIAGLISGTTTARLFDQLLHRDKINAEIDQLVKQNSSTDQAYA